MRCEGWERTGGAFTLGVPQWEQCGNTAIVELLLVQEGIEEVLPSCKDCWNKALLHKDIDVKIAVPLE